MTQGATLRLSAALGAALLLQGCVAAAIPVVAGGALAGRSTIAKPKAQVVAPAPIQAPSPAPTSVADQIDQPEVRIAETAAPAIAQPADVEPGLMAPIRARGGFDDFLEYTFTHAAPPAPGELQQSALLRDPAALDGERIACGMEDAAVIIDLDPADGVFAPARATSGLPGMADMLANLRANGVKIAWISGLSAIEAGAVRSALERSMLDPKGDDTLLLMRYGDDRKQTRRNEFAAEHCVLAIAGDAPTDFDELYEFIIDPANATALEALYGDGWFITPPVLSEE